MSNNINANILKQFVIKQVGKSLTQNEALKLGVSKEYQAAAQELDTNEIDLNGILKNDSLYEQFATLYVEEEDKKAEVDEKSAKEEQAKVKDKNGAGTK